MELNFMTRRNLNVYILYVDKDPRVISSSLSAFVRGPNRPYKLYDIIYADCSTDKFHILYYILHYSEMDNTRRRDKRKVIDFCIRKKSKMENNNYDELREAFNLFDADGDGQV